MRPLHWLSLLGISLTACTSKPLQPSQAEARPAIEKRDPSWSENAVLGTWFVQEPVTQLEAQATFEIKRESLLNPFTANCASGVRFEPKSVSLSSLLRVQQDKTIPKDWRAQVSEAHEVEVYCGSTLNSRFLVLSRDRMLMPIETASHIKLTRFQ